MDPPVLRADAERNRCQLMSAALAVFAERGLDAPLDEIARRAGVGNATLYRRFPTRCDLVAAVFASTLREVIAATRHHLAYADPWLAFRDHLSYLCELQAGNRAVADLIVSAAGGGDGLDQLRAEALDGLAALVDRAQASGALRPDFRPADLMLILMANAGLAERAGDTAPAAARRYLEYVLDGLHTPAGS
jgi:AcrR family transcriptional regulator